MDEGWGKQDVQFQLGDGESGGGGDHCGGAVV